MEKERIKTESKNSLEIDTDVSYSRRNDVLNYKSIKDLIDYLLKERENGFTHVEFSGLGSEWTTELTITPFFVTEESDEEFQKRINLLEAKRRQEALAAIEAFNKAERTNYERLKAKFGE